uniref:Uncharacterized protein n=1 Tax=Strigamia maritima TaxID=126957 RepID=T1IH85_STRMM
MLQIFTAEHTQWDRNLGSINFALRTAPSASTGLTPAMLTFLRELRPLWDGRDVTYDPQFDPKKPHGMVRMLVARMNILLASALRNKTKAQEKQKIQYDKHRTDVQFDLDDLVLVKTHPLSKAAIRYSASLEDRFDGPYIITKVISKNVYQISKPITLQIIGPVNIVDMKLYISHPQLGQLLIIQWMMGNPKEFHHPSKLHKYNK